MKLFFRSAVFTVAFLIVFCANPSSASAATLYWYHTGTTTNWTTLTGNWWTDIGLTSQAGSLPSGADTVITVGTTSPRVTLGDWTVPASITATSTGLWVTATSTDIGVPSFSATVTGPVTFNGYSLIGGGSIDGSVTFRDNSRNYGTGTIVSGNTVDFYDSSMNVRAINGTITFHDSSMNASNSAISGTVVFNDSSTNYTVGAVTGNATFNGSSSNQNIVTGNATFNGNLSENLSVGTTGSSTRRYTSDIIITRNFVTTGPWTVVADGARVDIIGATYNDATTFLATGNGFFVRASGGCGTQYSREGDTIYVTACGVKSVYQVLPSLSTFLGISSPASSVSVPSSQTSSPTTTTVIISPVSSQPTVSIPVMSESDSKIVAITPSRTHSFLRNLRRGDNHADVLVLQKLLKSEGFLKTTPNGFFGPATQASLIVFQKAYKLPGTGFFGPLTRGVANSIAI